MLIFFFFKQKTAYEMRISDWSSDVCSSDLKGTIDVADYTGPAINYALGFHQVTKYISMGPPGFMSIYQPVDLMDLTVGMDKWNALSPEMKQFVEMEVHVYSDMHHRSEEHTSELQSLMRISYAVFCLKKKKQHK